MLLDEPASFFFDDDLSFAFLFAKPIVLGTLCLSLLFVHLATQLDESLCLLLMCFHTHPTALFVHLFDAIVFCEFLHQLLADQILFLALLRQALLLGTHLVDVGVLHLLLIFKLLSNLHLVALPAGSFKFLEMELVPEVFHLLGPFVFLVHLAEHCVEDALFLVLDPLLFGSKAFLSSSFVGSILLDSAELLALFFLHRLLLHFLVDHELLESCFCLLLLLPTCLHLLLVLGGNLAHKLLNFSLFPHVFLHGLVPLSLLHRNLLLIDDLHPLALLVLLDVQLMLQLNLREPFVLHMLSDVHLSETFLLPSDVDL
mmetsp:Transcript_56895/g.120935  ORF Transcript_56895/g.120935 Transcript_56895/m.120935 type:complete len:314 (-) Transcript_56895:529-1470(-)